MFDRLKGKTAIVCGASRGLGFACADALVGVGVNVLIVARDISRLQAAAGRLSRSGDGAVDWLSTDLGSEEGRLQVFGACPAPDILITSCDGPPPGHFRDWSGADWHRALEANMVGPIHMIRCAVDGMIAREFGRIINITSSAVKAPIPVLGLSNGARAGLTGFVAGLARETARQNVTINNLLPGPFETERLVKVLESQAKMQNRTVEEVRAEWLSAIPTGKFGDPVEFGLACAFLCASSQINGQNILLDGGAYPGVF